MTPPTVDPGPTPLGTVLVVDDDPDVRHVAGLLLQRGGYEVVEAADGQAAVTVVGEQVDRIDAVLLDVMMPRMTGHEALGAIRDLRPGLPIVFFSGYDRSEVARHLEDPSAYTTFLAKPFSTQELLDTIAEAIDAGGGPTAR